MCQYNALIADKLEQSIQLPVIHIASATADAITEAGITKVGLLGTKFTMERDFFTNKLTEQGIEAIIPDDDERDFLHYTIFEELGRGIINTETKTYYINVINKLIARGAQGIILGCTEIPLLINNNDVDIPLFDTTSIHAQAAVKFALS